MHVSKAVPSFLFLALAAACGDSEPPVVSVSPVGSEPAVTAKPYGPTPPLAVSVWLYAVPAVGLGTVAGATTMVGAATLIV